MMIRLNNKGQSLVMFICLLPILLLIVLAIVDVSRMVIEKNKLNNINYIAISYYSSHKEDDDVTERIISLVKRNDENIINVCNLYNPHTMQDIHNLVLGRVG